MHIRDLVDSIVTSQESLEPDHLFDILLPKKESAYTIEDVDNLLHLLDDATEDLQRKNNEYFNSTLDENSRTDLVQLNQDLHHAQLEVMKFQCDVACAKEQVDLVNFICNNSLVKERQEMMTKEKDLKKSLKQVKFKPVKLFLERFANHLGDTVSLYRKLYIQQSLSYLRLFDWTQYHKAMFLLRACGKSLIDVEKFERLYQSDLNITLAFKQPIEQVNLNNFIEFQDTYSIETKLEIALTPYRRLDFKDLESDTEVKSILDSTSPLDYIVFETLHTRLESVAVQCCKFIIDLNMNYIEAHLTESINIDKLNESVNTTLSPPEEQNLPQYAFSPQDHITQIGQHLLTLRKQSKQFDNVSNESLRRGLIYLRQAQDLQIDVNSYKNISEVLMKCISRHCIRSLLGRTNHSILKKLRPNGRRQLATDALYLDNVLEDMGLLDHDETNVEKFKNLLILK